MSEPSIRCHLPDGTGVTARAGVSATGRLAAVVLPPNEGFSPESAGAIGLVVQRLGAQPALGFDTAVLGAPRAFAPFAVPPFQPVQAPAWLPGSRTWRYGWAVARALRRLRPDVIEVHNRPGLALRLARAIPQAPVLLVLHNDPQGMRGMASPAARARLRSLARVLTVSAWVRDRVMEGVPGTWPAPPVVLPNAIDPAGLPPPVPPPLRERSFLFAGRLVPEKGVACFLGACAEALPHLSGWRAEVIGARRLQPGGAPDSYTDAMHGLARRAGVEMAGYRPHAAVAEAMARAAVVVVPPTWPEPLGLTALEAMAGGGALICSGVGNLPDLVGGGAVLVPPGDTGALAAAMTALALDEPRRAALGAAGLARAAMFDIRHGAAALDEVRRAALRPWHAGWRDAAGAAPFPPPPV